MNNIYKHKKETKEIADYFDNTEVHDTAIYVHDYVEDEDVSSHGYMFWWDFETRKCGIEYQKTAGSDESEFTNNTADDFIAYVNRNI